MSAIPDPVGKSNGEQTADAQGTGADSGESMASGIFRRSRYAVAILGSALIFLYGVWPLVAPPAQYSGITFLGWPTGTALTAAGVLLVGLLATMVLGTVLTHPDAPHTGMFCGFLGMVALAYRGGPIYMLLRVAEKPSVIHGVYQHLALECLVWGAILVVIEGVNRWLYVRFFQNSKWLFRTVHADAAAQFLPLVGGMHRGGQEAKPKVHPFVASVGAFAISGVVAAVLLPVVMQSQETGQTVFAIFAIFALSSLLANWAFPDASSWPLLLAIPAVAAFGYLDAPTQLRYTGHAYVPLHYFSALARTLPINYIAAGVPGAIFGYYTMLRSRVQNTLETEHKK